MMRSAKGLLVGALGLLAGVYLVYPSLSVFELIPDAIPIIGSLDEATATAILISAFRYYGVDLTSLFRRDEVVEGQTKPKSDR